MTQGRTSIAFFVDPDDDTPLVQDQGTSIADYIRYRSGGTGTDRSGVAFTPSEQASVDEQQQQAEANQLRAPKKPKLDL